jgi:MFS family permease
LSCINFENASKFKMSTTTIAAAQAYEMHNIALLDRTAHNPVASSRLSNEIRPASLRNSHHGQTTSAVDVVRIPDTRLLAASFTQRTSARAGLVILQVSMINFLTSVSSGLIVVGLPRIAADLGLPEQLYLWPTSVYGLTAGSTLLLAGAIADVVGARWVDLVGCVLLGIFTLACGLSRTGIQLVLFRAFQGIATAMHLPCSVALITQFVPSGKSRNIGFACLGLSMPLGFSVGLVLGGILVDTVGWRVGFYAASGVMLLQAAAGFKIVPPEIKPQNVLWKLKNEIDWFGALIACAGLAMFSYVLAILSADSSNMGEPSAIAMLVISAALMVAFPFWMRFQEKKGRPALVPNYLWKSLPFSSICALTVLTWGVQNAMELFCSL